MGILDDLKKQNIQFSQASESLIKPLERPLRFGMVGASLAMSHK